MCVYLCASIVHFVKHHSSISLAHTMQTMSIICDWVTVLLLTLKLLSLSLMVPGNYCCCFVTWSMFMQLGQLTCSPCSKLILYMWGTTVDVLCKTKSMDTPAYCGSCIVPAFSVLQYIIQLWLVRRLNYMLQDFSGKSAKFSAAFHLVSVLVNIL